MKFCSNEADEDFLHLHQASSFTKEYKMARFVSYTQNKHPHLHSTTGSAKYVGLDSGLPGRFFLCISFPVYGEFF
jgi:hypothetical protein